MVSTFTSNIRLQEPARGDLVNTWDTSLNPNMDMLDFVCGNIATVTGLTSSPVTLASSQYKSKMIIFSGALTAQVNITFPTSFTKSYEILNNCTGTNNLLLTVNVNGGSFVSMPPGQIVEVVNDGVNIQFANLPPVGSYVDYAGTGVPLWVTGCGLYPGTPVTPPYLNCDGSTFSSSTFPQLAAILGSTTLPDWRGRSGATYNQATGRISAAVTGINGDVLFPGGGDQLLQAHTHTGTTGLESAAHSHLYSQGTPAAQIDVGFGFGGDTGALPPSQTTVGTGNEQQNHTHNLNTTTAYGAGGSQNQSPTVIYGITMIRTG